ncbi:MAG: SpoIIE family protein phosphatase [Bacteroidia bacterium]|nr:SpoIIE family protein phosphatase [Bacteroidia bacterium]
MNEGFVKIYGYTKDEFKAVFGNNIQSASSYSRISDMLNQCIKYKRAVNYTSCSRTKSDRIIWTQTTLTPVLDSEGEVSKLIAIDSDISKLKEAEEEIHAKNELLNVTNQLLEKKNVQITDSINYARLIQDAMLPSEQIIKKYLPDSFIFFKPRDIVSGDFYWFSVQNDILFFVAADCTGHGVPGAFMSMIGCTLLNDIINKDKIFDPCTILNKMNEGVMQALNQKNIEGFESGQDEGMTLTLFMIDNNLKKIFISSANQSYYIGINNEILRFDGDIWSIGGNPQNKIKKGIIYTSKEFDLCKDMTVYLLSDGFADQFSELGDRKYLEGRFSKLLKKIQNKAMNQQYDIIASEFDQWKGKLRQFDDVLVVGLKFS